MEVHRRIAIAATDDDVWHFVQDLGSVLPCIPGARLGTAVGDGGDHEATISVNAGEFSVTFAGTASVEIVGPRSAVISGKGRDRTGAIGAEARVRVDVRRETGDRCAIDVSASFDFSGVLAPAARAGGAPAASLLMNRFAVCVQKRFAA